jgi:hypothetical protein
MKLDELLSVPFAEHQSQRPSLSITHNSVPQRLTVTFPSVRNLKQSHHAIMVDGIPNLLQWGRGEMIAEETAASGDRMNQIQSPA